MLRIPQTEDAKRMRNVNDMNEMPVLTWTSDEDDLHSHYSIYMNETSSYFFRLCDSGDRILEYNSIFICYILGIKPPFRIIDGFIRRMRGKYGVEKVAMMHNGVFVVRFRTAECK